MSESNYRKQISSSTDGHKAVFTNDICARFEPVKKFGLKDKTDSSPPVITSFDYNDTGKLLVTTSSDHKIQLYDAAKGAYIKTIPSLKYGCDLGRFTHDKNTVIHSSTIGSHLIRQLDFQKESYVRYFKEHKGPVTSMEVSPSHELFATASLDDSIRLWDFRATNDQAFVPFKGPTKLAYDPSGMVLCASSISESRAVLYDVRNIQGGHFLEFPLNAGFEWNKLEFSNDNKYILFSCINGDSAIYDSFTGMMSSRLVTDAIPPSNIQTHGSSTFSPDGKFIFASTPYSSSDRTGAPGIGIFSLTQIDPQTKEIPEYLYPFTFLPTRSLRPRNIIFNPLFMQFCEGDIETFFWQPREF